MKTEISLFIVISILIIHWFADFILQTDEQAKNKSHSLEALTKHVLSYTIPWMVFCLFAFKPDPAGPILAIQFIIVTFSCHWVTDFFTSKINSKLWKDGKVHLFFVSIGFDQLLHFVQLLLTYQLVS